MSDEAQGFKKAVFAGGCFWCIESAFEEVPGVKESVSGYAGGKEANPTYKQVSSGTTGHRESVQVVYDPEVISYPELLDIFWRQIDPTDDGGQFNDRGFQYTTAIFHYDEEQKALAEKSKVGLNASGRYHKPVVTPILPAVSFYLAEDYHQDYYKKSPIPYKTYRFFSGRDAYIKKTWGEDAVKSPNAQQSRAGRKDEDLRKRLTPLQYKVTREEGTEPPFHNEYWDNKKEGIYVDIVSGEPLFSSTDKFDSGTGWPSFTRPLVGENVIEKEDRRLFTVRTEVRSHKGDSHLGHVFEDGPAPTGLRYCVNSASLRFIPKEKLEAEGYGEYSGLFQE